MDWPQQKPPGGGGDRPFNLGSSKFPASSSSSQSLRQCGTFLARYGVHKAPSQSLPQHGPHKSRPSSPPSTAIVDGTSDFPDAKTDDAADSLNTPWLTPPSSSDHDDSRPVKSASPILSTQALMFPTWSPTPTIPSPTSVERLIESKVGKLTINGITPKILSEWEDRHPFVRESDHINYEYDGSTSRMIIRCTVSPVHDSLQIFFKSHTSAALLETLGKDTYIDRVQMSSGSTFGGFTGKWNVKSRKQPDAYLQIDGYDFPTVVCESGWAETLDDLRRDATLWLMHTDGQTSVVLVVAFSESFEEAQSGNSVDGVNEVNTNGEIIPLIELELNGAALVGDVNENEGSQASTAGSLNPSESSSEESCPTEEESLLSTITAQTSPRDLAASLLALHRAGLLAKPLLGRVDATVHVFRRNAEETAIEEAFTATLLPAPASSSSSNDRVFCLTMGDLLGDLAAQEKIDPEELVEFPLEQLRNVVAKQIVKFERLRAVDRTEQVMKQLGVWEEMETFAQSKRNRKRKHEVDAGAAQGR